MEGFSRRGGERVRPRFEHKVSCVSLDIPAAGGYKLYSTPANPFLSGLSGHRYAPEVLFVDEFVNKVAANNVYVWSRSRDPGTKKRSIGVARID